MRVAGLRAEANLTNSAFATNGHFIGLGSWIGRNNTRNRKFTNRPGSAKIGFAFDQERRIADYPSYPALLSLTNIMLKTKNSTSPSTLGHTRRSFRCNSPAEIS